MSITLTKDNTTLNLAILFTTYGVKRDTVFAVIFIVRYVYSYPTSLAKGAKYETLPEILGKLRVKIEVPALKPPDGLLLDGIPQW